MSKLSVNELTDETGSGAPSFPNGLAVTGAALTDPEITGGIYLGGTGSANYLDDYEEGTCTLSVDGSSNSSTFQYTKTGRVVTVTGNLENIESVNNDNILGLPFVPSTNSYASVDVMKNGNYSSGYRPVLRARADDFRILKSDGNDHIASGASEIPTAVRFTITYFTNS